MISPASDAASRHRVRRYYAAATEDYLKYYEADWHHHMHYGFDRNLEPGGNPTENLVRYLAEAAGAAPGQRVLDAGCGVGGSAIWLAQHKGCRCVGITLMEMQARLARGFAAAKLGNGPARPGNCRVAKDAGGRSPRTGMRPETIATEGRGAAVFVANDFTHPCFKPGSFDIVWAIESFDHAWDKAAFVAEMARLLRPGGRLLVADGFRADRPFSPSEEEAYARFLAGWAVPHLCTSADMKRFAAAAGLEVAFHEDISDEVAPHAFAIYRFGLIFAPLRWLGYRLGFTSREKLGNALATYHQYHTFRRGLWTYEVFCLHKPRTA